MNHHVVTIDEDYLLAFHGPERLAAIRNGTLLTPQPPRKEGDPPPPSPAIPRRDRDPSRQLAVARYREDLSWLSEVPCDVIVYDKGGNAPAGVTTVSLPNEKREAGTILHHIVTRYDRLAPLTIFCQGHPFDHSPDFLSRLSLPYTKPTPLTTRYLANSPADRIKARDRVEHMGGFEVRYGDATVQSHETIPVWFDTHAWDYVFDCPMPRPLWFGYAATWAVPKEFILARPRNFWAGLLEVCDSGRSGKSFTAPPINPWSLEALWYYLWSAPKEFPHRKRLEFLGHNTAAAIAKGCKFRSKCACVKAVCSLGKGRDGEVYLSDCVECVMRGENGG